MPKLIGIDLGTTNCVTGVFHDGQPIVLGLSASKRSLPSVVAVDDRGHWLVGEEAWNQQITNPTSTIYSIKRFMGRRHREVASEEKLVPYEILGKADEFVRIAIGKHKLTPQELSARLLFAIKRMAERQLKDTVEGAIITVPAYFNDAQRQATRDAGRIAGLRVDRIINEPTAAAVAYGLEKKGQRCIVVFDLGGGTFDLSAMRIKNGSFQVLAVHGNTHLGGDDFDQRILDIVAEDFLRKQRIDLRQDAMALQRLKRAAQEAKATLSGRPEVHIMLPFICVDETGPKHLEYTLTRERFESVCSDLFDSLRSCCTQLMIEAGLKPLEIDDVVMVGGSTRIPRVQELAKEIFHTEELSKSINPDEVVALGAAILGGVIQGDLKNVNLMDVTSHSFGVENAAGEMDTLVRKNTPIPTSVKKVFTTPRDGQRAVPINVLEGESLTAIENRPLGVFRLTGIRRAPRGVPRIEVEFAIDANGILEVTACDQDTGRTQKIVVSGSCGLSDEEIEKMKQPTIKEADAESIRHQQIELRNHAERTHADLCQWLKYNRDAIPDRGVVQIQSALAKLQKKIEKDDANGIRLAMKKLSDLQHTYRKAG